MPATSWGPLKAAKTRGFSTDEPKMSILSLSVVDRKWGSPYNPPIAAAAARKRTARYGKPLKSKSNFWFQIFKFR
jgi:hypothetical protein